MPRRCVLPSCSSKLQASSNTKISMFKVPKDLQRKEQWERATGLKLKLSHVICALHFKKEDLIKQKVYRDSDDNIIGVGFYKNMMLAPDAIPSLHLPEPNNDCDYSEKDDCDDDISFELVLDKSDSENIILKIETDEESIKEEEIEKNHPLFDSLMLPISLPSHWTRITPCNNLDCIIFACFFQDQNSLSLLPFKEVCIFNNGKIVYCYNGEQIETDLDEKLTTIEALEQIIVNFDSWQKPDSYKQE